MGYYIAMDGQGSRREERIRKEMAVVRSGHLDTAVILDLERRGKELEEP